MARWQADSRGRLEQAALALYGERGFENTTVAEIAERAGLTERTFFRYFADKREVLFGGSAMLQELLVNAVLGFVCGVVVALLLATLLVHVPLLRSAIMPVAVLFSFLQRHLIHGLTAGAVKG